MEPLKLVELYPAHSAGKGDNSSCLLKFTFGYNDGKGNSPKGVVSFTVSTGWWAPRSKVYQDLSYQQFRDLYPYSWGIGKHSPVASYGEQDPGADKCEYLGGARCFFDVEDSHGKEWLDILFTKGSDGIWRLLQERWHNEFGEPEETPNG